MSLIFGISTVIFKISVSDRKNKVRFVDLETRINVLLWEIFFKFKDC